MTWNPLRAGRYESDCGYRITRSNGRAPWSVWDDTGFMVANRLRTLTQAKAEAELWHAQFGSRL